MCKKNRFVSEERKDARDYRFVKNNTVCINEEGFKKVTSLKNPAIEAFYKKSNLDLILNLLGTNAANVRKFNTENPCLVMQRVASFQTEMPKTELEMLAEMKALFPAPEVQEKIINSKSQILIVALAWWAKKIKTTWLEMFSKEPQGLFVEALQPRMVGI